MRGLIKDLETPCPIGPALPGVYHDDNFAQRLTSAFDDGLAPVICTLDNLEAYFDPELAPSDFVELIAAWVGLAIDETWSLDQLRTFVAQAVRLYRWRGTVRGLARHVALYTGGEPEIIDSGGVAWSATPDAALPGSPEPHLTVRVRVDDPAAIDVRRLDAIVAAVKPAHVPHQLEVLSA
jgi:phage tail-like protein